MRLALAAAALVMVCGSARADDFVRIGKIGSMTATFVGCKDQADEDKFKGLVREGDRQAAGRGLCRWAWLVVRSAFTWY